MTALLRHMKLKQMATMADGEAMARPVSVRVLASVFANDADMMGAGGGEDGRQGCVYFLGAGMDASMDWLWVRSLQIQCTVKERSHALSRNSHQCNSSMYLQKGQNGYLSAIYPISTNS